jgi:hypothetical protein
MLSTNHWDQPYYIVRVLRILWLFRRDVLTFYIQLRGEFRHC